MNLGNAGRLAVNFALSSGLLNPILSSLSETARISLDRINNLIIRAQLIYRHQRVAGMTDAATFGDFLTQYLSGITAGALDANQIDAQAVVSKLVEILVGVVDSSPKYWTDAAKDFKGFASSDMGQKFSGLLDTSIEQARPILEAALMQIRLDYEAAETWQASGDMKTQA